MNEQMDRQWWLPLRVYWQDCDRHRWAGPLAALGLAAGGLLAVLGLPPVDLHGPLHYAGVMSPTCGATRGVHAMMLGRFGEAWHYNPLSPLLVVGAAATLLREAVGRLGGGWPNLRIRHRRAMCVTAFVLLAGLEANQQAHADLLRTGPSSRPPLWQVLPAILQLAAAATVFVVLLGRRTARSR